MDLLHRLYSHLHGLIPVLAVSACATLVWALAHRLLFRRALDSGEDRGLYRWLALLVLAGLGILGVIFALPVSPETRNQLLGLLGLLLSATIALSSTTFLTNILAGMMLRAMQSFKPGDFVEVGELFGRVTERRLFYVEIQTINRDLATIPNHFMVSKPIRVIQAKGTIVSATVSLGYDTSHQQIEALLMEAARGAALEEPFMQVMELGDFAVTYRIAGFLSDVKQILTARSNLRKMMLDTLHGAGIEIVSPAFMNQRPQPPGTLTLPAGAPLRGPRVRDDPIPEELIFDKAEAAAKHEELREERDAQLTAIKELEERIKSSSDVERARLEGEIQWRRNRSAAIDAILETASEPK